MNKETLEEVLTFYESKTNEELLQEVQDIYYSYPVSGGIRRKHFYNRINMNGKTVRTIVCGYNKRVSMETYIKFLLVGLCPEWLLVEYNAVKQVEQEKLSKKQRNKEIAKKNKKLYQHEYYLNVTKEKRRLKRNSQNNSLTK